MTKENQGVPASPSGHQPSASATSADAPVSSQSGVPNAKVWRTTPYMPSHKQFSLSEDLTPERISEITRATPKPSKDGKCKFQWEFFASRYFEKGNGDFVEIAFPCAIWDYYDSRWSAYGPPEAFREIGLLPASGIEAATAGETGTGSTEGESPAPEGGDAR